MSASRALDDSLRPQAAAAGRERAADTIFFIRFEIITPSTIDTGRKIELLNAAAEGEVLRPVPYLLDILIQHVSNRVMLYGSLVPVKIHFVVVQKREARTRVSVPTNSQSSLFDERAPIASLR